MPEKFRNPRLTLWERLWTPIVPWLGLIVLRLVSSTLRASVACGGESVESLLRERRPMILATWHNRTFLCGHFIYRLLLQRGLTLAVLVSLSRDGELMARTCRLAGVEVMRGSATLGGLMALRAMRRALTENGWSVGLAADGSQGPVYDCKSGPLILSQVTGAPVLPMSAAADRYWRLKSWDRMIVPKPFSRVALAVGSPISVPADLDAEGLRAYVSTLSTTLTALGERAREALRPAGEVSR